MQTEDDENWVLPFSSGQFTAKRCAEFQHEMQLLHNVANIKVGTSQARRSSFSASLHTIHSIYN